MHVQTMGVRMEAFTDVPGTHKGPSPGTAFFLSEGIQLLYGTLSCARTHVVHADQAIPMARRR